MVKQKEKKQEVPNSIIEIVVQSNSYQFNIDNLTYGNLIDIEKLKITLSQDTHKAMLFARTRTGQLAYIAIDMIAFFTVLFPDMIQDLNVKSLLDLSPLKAKQLVEVYNKKFYPWWSAWESFLNEEGDEEKQKLEFEDDDDE